MSGSASIRNSRMKFAKGVLSAFMAVVTVVGFTPIVPYHAYADESEPAQEQPAVQESNELQPATAEQAAPSAPADEQTPATGAVAATEEGTQLSAAGEDATSLEPMAGVSCMWNNQYFETVHNAVAAIENDTSGATEYVIQMIGDSEEVVDINVDTKFIAIVAGSDQYGSHKIDLDKCSITVNGENAGLIIVDRSENGGAAIVANEESAIEVNAGYAMLGNVSVSATDLDPADATVDVAAGAELILYSGGISAVSEAAYAVSTAGDFAFIDGTVSHGIKATGSGYVYMNGDMSNYEAQSSSLMPLDGKVNIPRVTGAADGVTLADSAKLVMADEAEIVVSSDGVPCNGIYLEGGSAIIDNASISANGSAVYNVGGEVTIQNGATVASDGVAINVTGTGSVNVTSENSDDPTFVHSASGTIVGGQPSLATFNAGVKSTYRVPYASVADGYVCTFVDVEELADYWVINQTPNLPVVTADSLPYSGVKQAIVDLKGATVLNETQTGENKITATTDGGYTLEYDKTVEFDAASGTLITKEIGDYRVIATLEEGLTWPDGSTGTKVLAVSIVANKIAAPEGIDDLVYTAEAGVGVAQSLVAFPDDIVLTSQGVIGDDIVVDTNMGYQISFDKDADIAIGEHALTAVNAATYTLVLSLDDPINTTWADGSTDDITLEVTIAQATVTAPSVITGLTYNGSAQQVVDYGDGVEYRSGDFPTYPVVTTAGYTLAATTGTFAMNDNNDIVATNAGDYVLTASLSGLNPVGGPTNYKWADDNTTADKTLNVSIARLGVPQPTVGVGLTYAGEPISIIGFAEGVTLTGEDLTAGVVASDGYTITLNAGTGEPATADEDENEILGEVAGIYKLDFTLDDNHQWSNVQEGQETAVLTLEATIAKAPVAQPTAVPDLTYTGAAQQVIDLNGGQVTGATAGATTVVATTNAGYSFEYPVNGISYDELAGQLVATNAGEYPNIVATLDGNHIWSDAEQGEELDPVTLTAEIGKAVIAVPTISQEGGTAEWTGEPIELVDLQGAVVLRSTVEADTVTAVTNKNYTLTYPSTVSYVDGKLYATAVGDYAITATRESDGYNWSIDPKDVDNRDLSVSITKVSTAAPKAVEHEAYTYDGEAKNLLDLNGATIVDYSYDEEAGIVTATTDAGYALTYADDPIVSYDEENGVLTGTDAGAYVFTATLDDAHQWKDAAEGHEEDVLELSDSIAPHAIDKPKAEAETFTWTGEEQLLVKAGEGYTLSSEDEGVTIKEDGAYATAVGDYTITATLDKNHAWVAVPAPITEPAVVEVSISANKVAVPEAEQGVEYDGQPQTIVPGGEFYQLKIDDGEWLDAGVDAVATDVDSYTVTAKLIDPDNYTWNDGSTGVKEINASIAKGQVPVPTQVADLEYTGAAQPIILGNTELYTLTPSAAAIEAGATVDATTGNVIATKAGSYIISAALVDAQNYEWENGADIDQDVEVVMAKKSVEAPEPEVELTFVAGGQQACAANDDYGFAPGHGEPTIKDDGSVWVTDAGEYVAVASLKDADNYKWSDNSAGVKNVLIRVARKFIEKPTAVEGLVYNRAAQTLVAGGEGYTLTVYEDGLLPNMVAGGTEFPEGKDATATESGDYAIVAELVSTSNYAWDDKNLHQSSAYDVDPVLLTSSIAKANIAQATVTASNMAYTGAALEPAATVKLNGATLDYGTDYTVAYSNNKEVGTATITVTGKGNYTGTAKGTFKIVESLPMFRMYNPNSGEHFYTKSTSERDDLKKVGWRFEGIGWYAPASSSTPVYRLYNPNAGDHHYTTSASERDNLKKAGWSYEGVGWYSDDALGVKVLREYNPNAVTGSHNFTTNVSEHKNLVSLGWHDEGIAWYGVAVVS